MHLVTQIFTSLNHTSVLRLLHHCTAAVSVVANCSSFLFLVFTFSIRVQHVLQYVFAFARGQVVEEIQRCYLNESEMTEMTD